MKTLTNVNVQSPLATERGKIIMDLKADKAVGDKHSEKLLCVKSFIA
jgi:hypothetical protein